MDNNEAGDGVLEEFFDMFTGDIDNFDYSFEGKDTKSGSSFQGNVEDAKFSIDVAINKDVMTFTTTMTGGDENKAYSVKIANGDGRTGTFVIGTLKSGRGEGNKGSTTTISIPFTVDKNGNAVFDARKWLEEYDKTKSESTKQ